MPSHISGDELIAQMLDKVKRNESLMKKRSSSMKKSVFKRKIED